MHRSAVIAVCVVIAAVAAGAGIWRSGQHPALPRASCGQATIDPASSGPTSPLTCFSTAAQQCRSASIGVTWPGVDTGSRAVFTIEPGGRPCRVSEAGQAYGYAGGNLQDGPVTVTACQVAVVNGTGVMLRCGGQPVLIPAAVTTWQATAVSVTGRVRWETSVPLSGSSPQVPVAPAVAGATAVLAEGSTVYGLRLADGRRRWSWRGGPLAGGIWSWRGLAVVLTFTARSHAVLTGLTADTGRLRWSLDLGAGAPDELSATPDGGLALVTFGGTPEVVNLSDGTLRWAGPRSPSALTTAAGVAIVVRAGQATGYDERTGRAIWTVSGLPFQAHARLADGLVIVTAGLYQDGEPTAMTAIVPRSGRVAWRFDPGTWLSLDGAAPAGLLASDYSAPGKQYLVNPVTGRPRWQVTTAEPGGSATAVVTATDVIVLEGNYPYRVVDRSAADGRIRWSQPVTRLTGPAVTGPLVLLPDMPGTGTVLRAYRLGSGRLVWQARLPACLLAPPASLPGGTLIQSAGLRCAQTGRSLGRG
jgi:outer membrane protein assembly factor BamB